MKKKKINIIFTFIAIYSLFLGSIYLKAASLITKTTFNKMNESLTTFYNNFGENDKYLTDGPFTCSGDIIRCTGSSSIGTLSKKEYEIIGTNSYLSAKNSNNKYWTNNTNGSNAYVVNINSIEEKPQTDSYGIRGSVYAKNETTFSGTGTRIDPYVLNYKEQVKQDINLVAFYIDEDGDGSFEDEPNNGLVDKIDQETAYSLVSSACTDSTGQEFTDMITYNDINKSVTISPVQYQLSCTIRLKKIRGAIAVSTSYSSSYAIDLDYNLWVWGDNQWWQLGLGYFPSQIISPQKHPKKFQIISTGGGSFGIDMEGYLYAWGNNSLGGLGLGNTTNYNTPQKVGDKKWKTISTDYYHTLAIDTDGYLYSWGDNDYGQLGLGTTIYYNTPQKVGYKKWQMVSAGFSHSLAIDIDGYLYSWGYNRNGQLGLDSTTDYNTPQKVGDKKWKAISAGSDHSLAIDIDGYLYAWGNGDDGQLGRGNVVGDDIPGKVGDKRWKAISAGSDHSLAIDIDGYLYSWGFNMKGELGLGTAIRSYTTPQKVGEKKWKTIDSGAGAQHTLGIDEDGNVYSWGYNDKYQLGNESKDSEYYPYNLTLNGYFSK